MLKLNGLELVSIKRIKFTKLQWSGREIEEYELTKNSVLKKAIVAGECLHDGNQRPFLMKINLET